MNLAGVDEEVETNIIRNELLEKRSKIKRPSLFVVKGILECVNKGKGCKARFQEIARSTPELRNRAKLTQYLKLLVNDLWWLEKRDEIQKTPWNPTKSSFIERRWKVSWYRITDSGRLFLESFPKVDSSGEERPEP